MSKPVTYNWPALNGNFNEICLVSGQILIGQHFIINGTMSSTDQSPTRSPQVILPGISRNVIIHSIEGNLPNRILVTGLLDGKVVSENVIGPIDVGGKTHTNQAFNVVTSVSVASNSFGAVSAFTIGFGYIGWTNWFLADYDRTFHQFTAAAKILTNEAAFRYNLECTLDDVTVVPEPFVFDPTEKFPPAATGDEFGSTQDPFLYARFHCDDDHANPGTASARFTMLQQGIR